MVIPMKEDQGLFPQDNEHGVAQFRNLAQRKHPVPESTNSIIQEAGAGDADGVSEAVFVEDIEELRSTAVGAPHGEHGQEHIPHEQWQAQLQAGPALHVQLPAVDDDHVGADVVEAHHPVLPHPSPLFQSVKVFLEFKHVRVIGHRYGIHGGGWVGFTSAL